MSLLPMRDGAQIYYETQGHPGAQPLVLLHGNGEDSSLFEPQRSAFAPQYRLILIDSRAHGRSTRGILPLNFATMAQDVHAVLEHLGIRQSHVLGFSDGGSLAMHLALCYPADVRSLILVGANMNPRGVKLRYQLPIVLGYGLLCPFAAFNKGLAAKRDVLALMVHHPHLLPAQLSALQVPALVLAGQRDMIRAAHTRALAAALHTQPHILPGADHFLLFKQSQQANECILGFLQSVAAPSQSNSSVLE